MQSEYLESQYRPWPNPQKITERWAIWSQAYLDRPEFIRNIEYGTKPAERLDILKTKGVCNAPVLIFIHGGYWQRLDKDHYAFALKPLVDAGVVVANLNYTLCPESTLDEIVDEVKSACAWLWSNVSAYGGDPERIHIAGHSAGGHLTAMMAAANWPEINGNLPSNLIKSATPISGLFELEPLRRTSVNDAVRMDAVTAARHSPLHLIPGGHLPVCVVVGGAETQEFRRQSNEFTDTWRGKVATIEYIETPGKDHFTIIEAMLEPDHPLTCALLKQVGQD